VDIKLVVGLLAFFGVILGASLQYVFTRHIENQKHSRELKSKTYMDYLNSLAENSQHNYEIGSPEQKSNFSRTADAKARICLYGSKEVISAFSKFLELGGLYETPEQREAFTSMLVFMRSDSGSKKIKNEKEIQNIILGLSNEDT